MIFSHLEGGKTNQRGTHEELSNRQDPITHMLNLLMLLLPFFIYLLVKSCRYLLAEAGDTLFATFIGTNQYKDFIADVNILQGTIFHEDTAQDLADAVDSEQNSDQFGEENIGVSCREKPKQFGKSKPAAHRGFLARAKGIPALELYKLAQKKNRKLVLCGHSLGGAVAALATLAILRVLSSSSPTKEANRLQVKCITFSQPPVGNAALRDYVHRRGWQYYFKSYCIPEDVVPRILSPAYFHHYNAQTTEASFANRVDVRSEENKKISTEGAVDNNREQLVLGVGPVQKSLWRLSKLVPVEGVRKSLSVLQKQANIFEKASTQLDSYLQAKVDESEEEPWSLEIQEGSEGIALTPLSDNHGGTTEEHNRTEKINSSKVGCSKRWSRVPSLPSYIPFGEFFELRKSDGDNVPCGCSFPPCHDAPGIFLDAPIHDSASSHPLTHHCICSAMLLPFPPQAGERRPPTRTGWCWWPGASPSWVGRVCPFLCGRGLCPLLASSAPKEGCRRLCRHIGFLR
ncbi:unnamed protein product [Triticum turgidum subsp. durum]|uniref:Fungal lipase-type domain-containing protein n=1 Tax=Triticum turgidum subsp. durum TaxID=4567 RepID=A0A9R0YMK1_TRITD|nr:unnamed protein product [Triticum turgidum subsp. durum]